MKLSSKTRLSFLVLIILMGSVVVYATTIGPTGVYDTPWGNFTIGVNTPTINTGQGDNEVYDMNQNMLTTSSPTFDDVTISDDLTIGGVTRSTWPPAGGSGLLISDWLITGNGAAYSAYSNSGTNFTTASFSQVGNWVMGNLTGTSPNTVYFRGTFNLDTAPISVPDYAVLDGYGAEIDLTGNIAAIFQNENMGTARSDFVIIRGFKLDGNKASRTSGTGIEGTFWNSKIYDNIIVEMEEYGIDLRSYTSTNKAVCNINNNWIGSGTTGSGNKGGGLRLGYNGYPTPDCIIEENFFINNGNWQIIIEQGAVHRISSNHFAGYADAGDNIAGGIYAGEWNGGAGDSDVDQIGIYSNHFEQHQKQGIYVNASTGAFCDMWRIQGNDFFDIGNRNANNTYSVIHLHANGGSTRFGSITGNTGAAIYSSGLHAYPADFHKADYFIELEGANADYFVIDSNVIQSGQGAPAWVDYVDGGGSSVLGDNINIS